MRKLDYTTYFDKVLGGWIGKSAGGILGAPIEGYKRFNNIELSEKLFETNYPNDDLDLQVLWLDMAKKLGPSIRSTDFGNFWKNHVDFPWNEYGIATRNLKLGVYPPQSGAHNNWYWSESMGCPIRSEIWGMLCPGMPQRAAFYAQMDASLDHQHFSVHAEMFLSACESEAFFMSDPKEIFTKVLTLFDKHTTLYQLVTSVMKWHKECSSEVARGKIKGMWGDADFTSAPQNVGFSILALLESEGKFDAIMDALHLGHDSDCIAATVGAILGIINGQSNISDQWKKMVGNDLMVSPEIMGIQYAKTLSELAEETCKAGLAFIHEYNEVELLNCSLNAFEIEDKKFNIEIDLSTIESSKLQTNQSLVVILENMDLALSVARFQLHFISEDVEFEDAKVEVNGLVAFQPKQIKVNFKLAESTLMKLNESKYSNVSSSFKFKIGLSANGKQLGEVERGIPYYGAWLMVGPFIEDNPVLEPMDAKYPDHGLSSMPGIKYMNHDKLNVEKEFVSFNDLVLLAETKNYNSAPYLTQTIYPNNFKISLNNYFYGKGEKTVYLYSKVFSPVTIKKWLAIGGNAFYKVWINGNLQLMQNTLSRSWPADNAIEYTFDEGINHILIRIDMPLDKADMEIGFKDFVEKHPHQSQWDISLVPFV